MPRPRRPWGRWLLGLVLLSGMLAGGAWGVVWLRAPHTLPFEVVHIGGELQPLHRAALEKVVAVEIRGGFFSLDLQGVQQAISKLPWVEQATVRRLWPDRLDLHVRERRPVARWSGEGLVTAEGVVFHSKDTEIPAGMPNLVGPDAQSAPLVLERHREWQSLLQPRGVEIDELRLDARGAWSLILKDGLRIELGKTEVNERLARLLRVLPHLRQQAATLERIDLRYSNGLAVQWRAEVIAEPERPKSAKDRASPRGGTRTTGRI